MNASRALLVAAILSSLLLSGCTVRINPGDASDSQNETIRSSKDSSSWSITTNGCTITDKTPQTQDPEPVDIRESGDVTGPLSKSWSWKVENTSFQKFHVRLTLEGPQETPYYHANQLSLSLEGGCGQRPVKSGSSGTGNIQVSANTQPSGNVVDWEGDGLTMLGAWTLKVEAQEALLVYDVEVVVEY